MSQCQICGRTDGMMYARDGNVVLKAYHSVCRPCVDEHFAPTTIVLDPVRKRSASEWTPAEQEQLFLSGF